MWPAERGSTGFATSAVVMAEGRGACLLTVAVRLLGGTETAQHTLECARSDQRAGQLQPQQWSPHAALRAYSACGQHRGGASMGIAASAVVMVEGGGACLLTVAVRLLGGTETAYHALE